MPPRRSLKKNGKYISTYDNRIVRGNGYYHVTDENGTHLVTLDVDNKMKPIKPSYIGGTTKESQRKYWRQAPQVLAATDSIASMYGINPDLLRSTLDREGFTDDAIRFNNTAYLERTPTRDLSTYNVLKDHFGSGYDVYGLDDTGDRIKAGLIRPKGERFVFEDKINEHNRPVLAADGKTTKDNIGLTAANLRFFRDKAKKDFPNYSDYDLDVRANSYYNIGPYSPEIPQNKLYKKFSVRRNLDRE